MFTDSGQGGFVDPIYCAMSDIVFVHGFSPQRQFTIDLHQTTGLPSVIEILLCTQIYKQETKLE